MTTKRRHLSLLTVLIGVAGLTVGACAAEESASVQRAVEPTRAVADTLPPAGSSLIETAEAAEDAPTKPLDEEAVRALAEEVARLRAELADVTDELEQTRAAAGDAPTTEAVPPLITPLGVDPPALPATSDGPAPQEGEPVVGEEKVPEEPFLDEELDPSGLSETGYQDSGYDEPGVEREIVIEREVDAGYAGEPEIIVVQEEQPDVIYEQVVYEGDTVYQWVPYGHVHHIGCGHHYYGCSCHPWYYSCSSGVSFHVSSSDWSAWVGWGHPYSYYSVGYWSRGYDYDYWNDYRHDYYAHHRGHGHGHRDGARKRSKRAYRRGYEDGFDTGADTPGRSGPRGSAADAGDRGNSVVAAERTRRGSAEGRSIARGSPARPGGEDASAGRTATRSREPVVGADRSRFRSAAERERARREAAVRTHTPGASTRPPSTRRAPATGRAPPSSSRSSAAREAVRRSAASRSADSARPPAERRSVAEPTRRRTTRSAARSSDTTRSRTRPPAGTRAAPGRRDIGSTRSATPERRTPSRAAPRRSSPRRAAPSPSTQRRAAPTRTSPTRTSPTRTSPTRTSPTRTSPTRSRSPRRSQRSRGARNGRNPLGS